MRWIGGGKAAQSYAASAEPDGSLRDAMARDRREPLCSYRFVHRARHGFEREPHGDQENSVWNGHYVCMCHHPLFVFNQLGDLERCSLRPGNVHSADAWDGMLKPVVARYQGKVSRIFFRADAAFAMPEVYDFLEVNRSDIRFACRPTKFSKRGSDTYSSVRLDDLRMRSGGSMPISAIRREAGRSHAG